MVIFFKIYKKTGLFYFFFLHQITQMHSKRTDRNIDFPKRQTQWNKQTKQA